MYVKATHKRRLELDFCNDIDDGNGIGKRFFFGDSHTRTLDLTLIFLSLYMHTHTPKFQTEGRSFNAFQAQRERNSSKDSMNDILVHIDNLWYHIRNRKPPASV